MGSNLPSLFVRVFVFASVGLSAATEVLGSGSRPLAFVENRGQFDPRACFVAREHGVRAYFTRDAFVLQLAARGSSRRSLGWLGELPADDAHVAIANVFLTFEGASRDVSLEGIDLLPGRYNYFLGNDPSKWCTDVPAYACLRYCGLYAGVELLVHDQAGRLEYDLLLAPGVDLARIVVRCEGAESLRIDEEGALVLDTAAGPIEQPRPAAYQIDENGERELIECSYRLLGGDCFGFEVASRALERPLVIDPGLVYSTFLGGLGDDAAAGCTVDAAGEAYFVGHTDFTDFPTTPGSFDTSYNGGRYDAFVAKLSADGSTLVYSTLLGGSGDEHYPNSLVVDAAGEVVFTGQTDSPDFPVTSGAYDTIYNGNGDVFVVKLSASGSSLLASTFLGGSATEVGQDIVLDASGAILVSGTTGSSNFPTTPGAYDTSYNGGAADAFVAKLSADGKSLLLSTFLGGSSDDGHDVRPIFVAVDAAGGIHVTGTTYSSDFPTTPGAFDTSYNGGGDTFVAKLSADGKTLVYSTFLGGSDLNYPGRLVVDSAGATVLTGTTYSSDFPTTPGAYDTSFNGFIDGFVAKLSADGKTLVYSTFLGGSSFDGGNGITLDSTGAALVVGATTSSDFPTTPDAYDTTYNGGAGGDTVVVRLSADGKTLLYASFLGGSASEGASSIAVDATGRVTLAGATESSDFPTTSGAYDTTYNGGVADAFVTKLTVGCVESPPGTVSWWPGDGTPDDISGTNDGKLHGHATYVDGLVGPAFSFGYFDDDAVAIANAPDLQLQTFTIEAWIKRVFTDVAGHRPSGEALFFGYGLGGYGYGMFADGRFFLTKIGVSNVQSQVVKVTDTSYHHVAVTKSRATVKFYVDGVEEVAPAYDPGFEFTTDVAIGNSGDFSGSFIGDIDELAVYDRALAASEIQAIFDHGDVGKCKPALGCSGDPGFTLSVPAEAPIGEFIDICTSAPAGDLVALLASGGQGPTVTPFGTFCLDFPPLVIFTFEMPAGGSRCFHRFIPCVPDLVGVTGYLQFIALKPAGGVDGLSNQSSITVVDHGACG
jgi:hypothetical protein